MAADTVPRRWERGDLRDYIDATERAMPDLSNATGEFLVDILYPDYDDNPIKRMARWELLMRLSACENTHGPREGS